MLLKKSSSNFFCQILFLILKSNQQLILVDIIIKDFFEICKNPISFNALCSILENGLLKISQSVFLNFLKTYENKFLTFVQFLRILECMLLRFEDNELDFIIKFIENNILELIPKRMGFFLIRKYCKLIKNEKLQINLVKKLEKNFYKFASNINGSLLSRCIIRNFNLKEDDKLLNNIIPIRDKINDNIKRLIKANIIHNNEDSADKIKKLYSSINNNKFSLEKINKTNNSNLNNIKLNNNNSSSLNYNHSDNNSERNNSIKAKAEIIEVKAKQFLLKEIDESIIADFEKKSKSNNNIFRKAQSKDDKNISKNNKSLDILYDLIIKETLTNKLNRNSYKVIECALNYGSLQFLEKFIDYLEKKSVSIRVNDNKPSSAKNTKLMPYLLSTTRGYDILKTALDCLKSNNNLKLRLLNDINNSKSLVTSKNFSNYSEFKKLCSVALGYNNNAIVNSKFIDNLHSVNQISTEFSTSSNNNVNSNSQLDNIRPPYNKNSTIPINNNKNSLNVNSSNSYNSNINNNIPFNNNLDNMIYKNNENIVLNNNINCKYFNNVYTTNNKKFINNNSISNNCNNNNINNGLIYNNNHTNNNANNCLNINKLDFNSNNIKNSMLFNNPYFVNNINSITDNHMYHRGFSGNACNSFINDTFNNKNISNNPNVYNDCLNSKNNYISYNNSNININNNNNNNNINGNNNYNLLGYNNINNNYVINNSYTSNKNNISPDLYNNNIINTNCNSNNNYSITNNNSNNNNNNCNLYFRGNNIDDNLINKTYNNNILFNSKDSSVVSPNYDCYNFKDYNRNNSKNNFINIYPNNFSNINNYNHNNVNLNSNYYTHNNKSSNTNCNDFLYSKNHNPNRNNNKINNNHS